MLEHSWRQKVLTVLPSRTLRLWVADSIPRTLRMHIPQSGYHRRTLRMHIRLNMNILPFHSCGTAGIATSCKCNDLSGKTDQAASATCASSSTDRACSSCCGKTSAPVGDFYEPLITPVGKATKTKSSSSSMKHAKKVKTSKWGTPIYMMMILIVRQLHTN